MAMKLIFVLHLLMLINYVARIYSVTMCSDSDVLQGKIRFIPGDVVVNGTNVTIQCIGKTGQIPPNENPQDFVINAINIFGPDKGIRDIRLHSCSGVFIKGKECHYNLSAVKELGKYEYHCQFRTRVFSYACVSSKNLSVTLHACETKPGPCHVNATCEKRETSFKCKCSEGFTGDGKNCTNIQECLNKSSCHPNATCTELKGSFSCGCKSGFVGDGQTCMLTCNDSNSTCNITKDPENCVLSEKTSECYCKKEFVGNGTHCEVVLKAKPKGSKLDSSQIIVIVVVVVLALTVFVILAMSLSFYRKRRITREETFNRAVDELNKCRSGSKDNLGILFPEDKKVVQSSPRRKLPSIRDHNSMEDLEEENILSYICVLDDWEIDKDNLTILDKKLGGGCFGVVKEGIYKQKDNDSQVVAVKMLKDSASAADCSDLLMELFILKEVNKNPHPNVIKLIGAYTSEEPILVITEFCSRGNLRHLLRKSRIAVETDGNEKSSEYKNIHSTLSHITLLQISIDIARGMQHLAANQFVHRDLSARNILIGANYEAKVSDFGLARPIAGANQMYVKSNRNLLPVKWMAVESLTQGIFRTSSDVWAYGVVLWEITTLGEEPYPDITPFDTFTLVASGKRMEKPPHCSEELYSMMRKCWETEQESRPTFQDIYDELKKMLSETDHRVYINIVEMHDEEGDAVTDDRRISVESLADLRYT